MSKYSKLESKVVSFFRLFDENNTSYHNVLLDDYTKLHVSDINYHLTINFSVKVLRNDLIYNRVTIDVIKHGSVIRGFSFYFYSSCLIVELFRSYLKSLPYDDLIL